MADQAAYAELYRLTAPHLYGVALRILRETALAEDLLQAALVINAARAKGTRMRPWVASTKNPIRSVGTITE